MREVGSRRPSAVHGGRALARQLGALIAVSAIAVGCGGPSPTVPPVPSTTPLPSSLAQGSPSTESPAPDDGTWTAVRPTGINPVAQLRPLQTAGELIATTTAFELTSLDGRRAVDLARRVVSEPAVALTVTESAAGAILRPARPLAPATRYRFSLTRADGTVEAAWTSRTAGPLHLTDTVPGDQATSVPTDAGIELTFDQAGVTADALAAHLAISPPTAGRIEVRGRVLAFVPDRQLQTGTLYTVTVRHGLPLGSTGETLATDTTIRFETAAERASRVRVWLTDSLADASPRERAALGVWVDVPEGETAPTSLPVAVHRLAGLDAAIAAWRAADDAPEWTLASTAGAVSTANLPLVLSGTVRIQATADGTRWVQLPGSLPAGWYAVTESYAGVPRQLVLQVTDTSVYALVTTTRTAVWVNDLRSGLPVVGATASLGGLGLDGATDSLGLLSAETPSPILAGGSSAPLLLLHAAGATTFRPLLYQSTCGGCSGKGERVGNVTPSRWWTMLVTDRSEYRQTDTVNVLGVARQRISAEVPASVRIGLYADADPSGGTSVPVQTATATPDRRGMYAASLPIANLPTGGYWIRATAGGEKLGERWLAVSVIRKPAYSISLVADRHAVISGQPVRGSVSVAFYEGTPMAGDAIALQSSSSDAPEATLTTDLNGQGSALVRPHLENGESEVVDISARATQPEEADIAASTQVMVFAGSAYVTIDASAGAKTVAVAGAVNDVAWSRYESTSLTDLWNLDPRGAPRTGAVVRIAVSVHVNVLHQTGTEYDFVTKRVVPKYEVRDVARTLPARTVVTGADGTFRIEVPAIANASGYEVTATYRDEAGRDIPATDWASPPSWYGMTPELIPDAAHRHGDGYRVGETVRLQFTGGAVNPPVSRYLYLTLQQGLQAATVSDSAAVAFPFTSASIPDVSVVGVRFNGAGYDVVPWTYTARMAAGERTMEVALSADQARYQPGATATVTIRTRDALGRPVAASVFVQAVDEKLYAIGAASDNDPVGLLYVDVPDGVVGSARSHRTPGQDYGGGKGDTTGGGGGGARSDFRDWLVAKVVHTDASGTATLTIPLSDDLTAWRVTGTALDASLEAGTGQLKLQVGLPFFVDAVLAPEFVLGDRPVLRVRSFGTELAAGAPVTFTISSDTLPMTATTISADAFASAYLALPTLTVGDHRFRIEATAGEGGTQLRDAMVRTFKVVERRATQVRTTWSLVTDPTAIEVGSGSTRLDLVDAGRGRVVPLLEALASPGAVRSDQDLAAALANRVLADQFGLPPVATADPEGLDPYRVQGGLAVVPWGSLDLDVSALAAMTGDSRLSAADLENVLLDASTDANSTPARRYLALAGLAALGYPEHDQIATAAALPGLTVEERVNLALAALEAGDETLAGQLVQQILVQHGLRSGHQVRIDPGPGVDATVATARLAIVAASLGDPVAAEMGEFIAAHPSATTLVDLEQALAARGWATRVASAAAAATLTVDGQSKTVRLSTAEGVSVVLTPAQAQRASVAPVSGTVLAVQAWAAPLQPSSLRAPSGVSVTRHVSPTGDLPSDGLLVVTYDVALDPSARGAGWRLVDCVPSGLAPIRYFGTFSDTEAATEFVSPSTIDGQCIAFSVGWDPKRDDYQLRYVARVVSPGTYRWEPAVLQSLLDPASGLTVSQTTITVREPAG